MTAHHRFWVRCPYCEGEYRQGDDHTLRDCIAEVIKDHRFALTDTSDYDETAGDIVDMLEKRGLSVVALQGTPEP